MAKVYGYLNAQNVVEVTIKSEVAPVGYVECEEGDFGKKWDGTKFIDAPKKYKVWSAVAFVTICGQAVYDAIMDGNQKDLRYFKYILDKADVVDLNIPQYFGMVQLLKTRGIMSQAIFDQLTVQE